MNDDLSSTAPRNDEIDLFITSQLGPSCLEAFQCPKLRKECVEFIFSGDSVEDAVLRIAHREAITNPLIADEFLGHFLTAMMRIGHFSMSHGLQRFLDSDDLVNSVAGSIWQDLAQTEFRTRREFLAYLAKRLQWKAADRARGFQAGKRREDLHKDTDFDTAGLHDVDQAGPSTLAGNAEEKDRLILTLLRLAPRDREILTRHLRGESHAQVAEALDLSPVAARKALQRAIERAKKIL